MMFFIRRIGNQDLVGDDDVLLKWKLEIEHNMCRQTGPTAVSRTSLPSHT
jgi:hypothetical protein